VKDIEKRGVWNGFLVRVNARGREEIPILVV